MSTPADELTRERQGREDAHAGRPRQTFSHESHARDYAQGYDRPAALTRCLTMPTAHRLAFRAVQQDGARAHNEGQLWSQNPHPVDTDAWAVWNLGWWRRHGDAEHE